MERTLILARSIAETAREPFLVLNAYLEVLAANEAFGRAFHVKPELLEGRRIFDIGEGAWDRPELRELLERTVPKKGHCNDCELQLGLGRGGKLTVLLNVRLLKVDGKGELVLLSLQDLSERRKAERALRESERRFSHLLEGMPLGVLMVDAEGRPCYANRTFENLLGKDLAQVESDLQEVSLTVALSAFEAGTGRPYPCERDPLVRALSGMGSAVCDMEIRRPDRTLLLEVTGAPIFNENGDILYAAAIYRDATAGRNGNGRPAPASP